MGRALVVGFRYSSSYLPRWIGYAFGSLLHFKHFVVRVHPPLQRSSAIDRNSEAFGVSLAAFSMVLPYFGKFLEVATTGDQSALPEGNKVIFIMSKNLSDTQKEDFGGYILPSNTNTCGWYLNATLAKNENVTQIIAVFLTQT